MWRVTDYYGHTIELETIEEAITFVKDSSLDQDGKEVFMLYAYTKEPEQEPEGIDRYEIRYQVVRTNES